MVVRVKDSIVATGLAECIAKYCAENGYNSFSSPSEYEGSVVEEPAVLMGIDLCPGDERDTSILVADCNIKGFMNKYQKHVFTKPVISILPSNQKMLE